MNSKQTENSERQTKQSSKKDFDLTNFGVEDPQTSESNSKKIIETKTGDIDIDKSLTQDQIQELLQSKDQNDKTGEIKDVVNNLQDHENDPKKNFAKKLNRPPTLRDRSPSQKIANLMKRYTPTKDSSQDQKRESTSKSPRRKSKLIKDLAEKLEQAANRSRRSDSESSSKPRNKSGPRLQKRNTIGLGLHPGASYKEYTQKGLEYVVTGIYPEHMYYTRVELDAEEFQEERERGLLRRQKSKRYNRSKSIKQGQLRTNREDKHAISSFTPGVESNLNNTNANYDSVKVGEQKKLESPERFTGLKTSPLDQTYNKELLGLDSLGKGSALLCSKISQFVDKMKDTQTSAIARLRHSLINKDELMLKKQEEGRDKIEEEREGKTVEELQDTFLRAQRSAVGKDKIPSQRRNWMKLAEEKGLESIESRRERFRRELAQKKKINKNMLDRTGIFGEKILYDEIELRKPMGRTFSFNPVAKDKEIVDFNPESSKTMSDLLYSDVGQSQNFGNLTAKNQDEQNKSGELDPEMQDFGKNRKITSPQKNHGSTGFDDSKLKISNQKPLETDKEKQSEGVESLDDNRDSLMRKLVGPDPESQKNINNNNKNKLPSIQMNEEEDNDDIFRKNSRENLEDSEGKDEYDVNSPFFGRKSPNFGRHEAQPGFGDEFLPGQEDNEAKDEGRENSLMKLLGKPKTYPKENIKEDENSKNDISNEDKNKINNENKIDSNPDKNFDNQTQNKKLPEKTIKDKPNPDNQNQDNFENPKKIAGAKKNSPTKRNLRKNQDKNSEKTRPAGAPVIIQAKAQEVCADQTIEKPEALFGSGSPKKNKTTHDTDKKPTDNRDSFNLLPDRNLLLTNEPPEFETHNTKPDFEENKKGSSKKLIPSDKNVKGLLSKPISKKNSRLKPSNKKKQFLLDENDSDSDVIRETKKVPNVGSIDFGQPFLEDNKKNPFKSSLASGKNKNPKKRVSFQADDFDFPSNPKNLILKTYPDTETKEYPLPPSRQDSNFLMTPNLYGGTNHHSEAETPVIMKTMGMRKKRKGRNVLDDKREPLMKPLWENPSDQSFQIANDSDSYDEDSPKKRLSVSNNGTEATDSGDEIKLLNRSGKKGSEITQQEISDLLLKKRFIVLLGIFFFLFFASTFLWIILFGLLNSSNLELGNYVVNIPTLGDYYQAYEKFYHVYDDNRDVVINLTEELDINSNPRFKRFVCEKTLDMMRAKMFEFEKSIAKHKILRRVLEKDPDFQNELGQRDILASQQKEKSFEEVLPILLNGSRSQIKEAKNRYLMNTTEKTTLDSAKELMTLIDEQLANYSRLEANELALMNMKKEINIFFEDISRKIIKLYSSSFSLIDIYGEFYVLTERIWVTCDNIFRLFQKRAKEIDNAMTENHFGILESHFGHMKLLQMEYSSLEKINQFPALKVNLPNASFMMCTLTVEIKNEEMTYLGTEFELRMVLNNRVRLEHENRFTFKIDSAKQSVRIYDMFEMEAGSNSVEVFARLSVGDVEFYNLDLKCLSFLKYPDIMYYSDD